MIRTKRYRHHAGLTLLELMIGLMSLSVIGMATATLMSAAGNAWETRADNQLKNESLRLTANRLNTWVRESQRIIASHVVGSNTELLLWTDDDHFEGEVNLGELMLITYDSDEATLTLYAADLTDAQKQNAVSNMSFTPTLVGTPSFPGEFRAYNSVGAYPLAEGISRYDLTLVAGDAPYTSVHIVLGADADRATSTQIATVAGAIRTPEQTVDFGYGAGSGGVDVVVSETDPDDEDDDVANNGGTWNLWDLLAWLFGG